MMHCSLGGNELSVLRSELIDFSLFKTLIFFDSFFDFKFSLVPLLFLHFFLCSIYFLLFCLFQFSFSWTSSQNFRLHFCMRISLHFLKELVRSTTMNLKVEAHWLNRKNLIWNRLEQKNTIEHYSFTISRIILFIKINIFIWLENFRKCFNNDFLTSIVVNSSLNLSGFIS